MKEKIGKISRGIIEYELPRIILSKEKLVLSAEMWRRQTGRIGITNSSGVPMKGIVCSDNRIFEITTPQFVGVNNTVEYVIRGDYITGCEDIAGEITFVTDCGEVSLPYRISVSAPSLISSEGTIADMSRFVSLARYHWEEALRLFNDPAFLPFLQYHEPHSVFLLEVLRRSQVSDRALEEFLVVTGKKMGVVLQSDEDRLDYSISESRIYGKIQITKSSWGYVNARVTSSAEFLVPDREQITMESFHDNRCDIPFRILPEKLGYGTSTATLAVEAQNQQLFVTISVDKPIPEPEALLERHERKEAFGRLYENYLSFRMNHISAGRYVAEAEGLVSRLEKDTEESNIALKLYRVHLDRIAGRENAAAARLRALTDDEWMQGGTVTKALYLYLKAERASEGRADLMEQLYVLCSEKDGHFVPALLLLELDPRYAKNRKLKLDELRGMYDDGNRSPILFSEAAALINAEPSLLHETGNFEMQTMAFAVRHDFLEREAAIQFSYLAERLREYKDICYLVLAGIYRKFQLKEALSALCQMLIRARKKDLIYAEWYKKGVEEQLRIPELYEYYMYTKSGDTDEVLEPAVLTYFAYNSKLHDKRLSYLYANIVVHKDSNREAFESYKNKIFEYALTEMREQKNDPFLTILYNECMNDETLRKEFLNGLEGIAFRHEIRCSAPGIRYVCVAHRELDTETIVPFVGGIAQVDIYTEHAVVVLMDEKHNRYLHGIPYEDHKLMHAEDSFQEAYQVSPGSNMILLWLAEKALKERKTDPYSIELRKKASRITGLRPAFADELNRALILHFYDSLEDSRLDSMFNAVNWAVMPDKQRGKMLGLLINRSSYEKVLELMLAYGYKNVEMKALERFATEIPQEMITENVEFMTDFMYDIFRQGRRSSRIFAVLLENYQGRTVDMYNLWQEANDRQIDTSKMDERLLAQILFTEAYLPYGDAVFRKYYNPLGNRQLCKAYMTYVAYKYLLSDAPISEETVAIMKKDTNLDEYDICILALLKLCSEAEDLSTEDRDFAEYWLTRMESRGKVLPEFLKLCKYFPLPESLEDKRLIEYRTNPKHRVTLHYSFRFAGKRQQRDVPMRDICYGIFVKELVLFYGETIEYVISDESADGSIVTEKTTLVGTLDKSGESTSRFAQINRIIASEKEGDRNKALELLDRYIKDEFAISQLFREIKD